MKMTIQTQQIEGIIRTLQSESDCFDAASAEHNGYNSYAQGVVSGIYRGLQKLYDLLPEQNDIRCKGCGAVHGRQPCLCE